MNKIKNVFQRTKTEDRRPQQFVLRQSSYKTSSVTETPIETEEAPPAVDFAELSEMERPIYESWWKDLDPFNLQKINNETILKFLNGCTLQDNKLEQILALFDSVKDGLNKYQFFAMLRLIAHAQNGRKISRALIYLGAPIPHFNTNAIDAIIKTIPETPTTQSDRKSWWGYEKQQQLESRRSYMGPFTAHTPIPNSPSNYHDNNLVDFFYDNWKPPIIPVTLNDVAEEKSSLTHSRSRSAGAASDFKSLPTPPPPTNPYHSTSPMEEPQLHSSRSSLSLNELNTGSSLLLTQKFVYQSPSLRNRELNANNPFNIPSYQDLQLEKKSPFDDDNSQDINNQPNAQQIPPPPVPDQSTKPAFPKYTRTNSKRNSTSKPHNMKHARHKSTSSTQFY